MSKGSKTITLPTFGKATITRTGAVNFTVALESGSAEIRVQSGNVYVNQCEGVDRWALWLELNAACTQKGPEVRQMTAAESLAFSEAMDRDIQAGVDHQLRATRFYRGQ